MILVPKNNEFSIKTMISIDFGTQNNDFSIKTMIFSDCATQNDDFPIKHQLLASPRSTKLQVFREAPGSPMKWARGTFPPPRTPLPRLTHRIHWANGTARQAREPNAEIRCLIKTCVYARFVYANSIRAPGAGTQWRNCDFRFWVNVISPKWWVGGIECCNAFDSSTQA